MTRPIVTAPDAVELISRIEEFLAEDVAPEQANQKLRFRILVAANLLRIVRREMSLLDHWVKDVDGYLVPKSIEEYGGSLAELADDLRAGKLSIVDPEVYAVVREHVEGKVSVDAPALVSQRR